MKRITMIMILVLLAFSVPKTLSASPKKVKVTLPSFNVTLNGVKVENAYRQYPLIVYNDITYFPMTYYDSRFLGVEAVWNPKNGLEINKTGVTAAYRDDRGTTINHKVQQAEIRTEALQLNGKAIRYTGQEQYPFLIFREVTYFPLTWNYAVKELGWSYQFDNKKGLTIKSTNPQVTKVAGFPGITEDGWILYRNHIYSLGSDGVVLKSPIGTAGKSEVIYQLPLWSEGDGTTRVYGKLSAKDGELWLYYHQGGAVMGHDEYLRLNEYGKFEVVESGYLAFRTFGNIKIKVGHGVPPSPNNLSVKIGDQKEKSAGDPSYLYGWSWKVEENGTSGGNASSDLYLIHNELYLLAYNTEKDTDFSRIHKVNLKTNETTRVSNLEVTSFIIAGAHIYADSKGALYRLPLMGGSEERLYPQSQLFSISEDDGYVLCTFTKGAHTPYTLIVYDKTGTVIFKTSDVVSRAAVEDGKLYYYEQTSKKVYTASLR